MNDHRMQPSDSEIGGWIAQACQIHPDSGFYVKKHIANTAYSAGADAQLDICKQWLSENYSFHAALDLLDFCRPAPTPKERLINILESIERGEASIADAIKILKEDSDA
jgi:hypothetical protein